MGLITAVVTLCSCYWYYYIHTHRSIVRFIDRLVYKRVNTCYYIPMETDKHPGKLIMLKGLPRSGKSMWARDFVKKSGNWYRVNKDLLRTMLHDDKYTPQNEKITMKAQMLIVRGLLESGKNVLVDDTNLGDYHRERWSNLAKELKANFETKEFTASVDELVDRDLRATEQRGRHVIEKMALQYDYLTYEADEVVVCDIDGTIANCDHRRDFVRGEGKKDWDGFFGAMDGDSLMMDTMKIITEKCRMHGKKLLFVSARPEKYREVTEAWLAKHDILPVRSIEYALDSGNALSYEALLLRQDGDSRDDTIVKKQILDIYLTKQWIDVVIDDRPAVIRMWRDNDLEVIDVGEGIEF